MRRDLHLVRRILMTVADYPVAWDVTDLDPHPKSIVGWHVAMMIEAGLMTGVDATARAAGVGLDFINCRLTWAGSEFLALAKDQARWDTCLSIVDDEDVPVGILMDHIEKTYRADLDRKK